MALFKTLKRALGFENNEEEDFGGIDARVTPLRDRVVENDTVVVVEAIEHDEPCVGHNDSAQGNALVLAGNTRAAIFESVVKVFNESLPEFLKNTVNEKAQCEYLYGMLDDSVKRYIEDLEKNIHIRCAAEWEQERHSFQAEIENLRMKSLKNEEESSDSKKMQLSAERQKRALNERVSDLEKQMATLQAENEQYVLENKSLVNKLRLLSVLGNDCSNIDAAVADKIDELTVALEKAVSERQNLDMEIAELKETVARNNAQNEAGLTMAADLNVRLERAVEERNAKAAEAAAASSELAKIREELENVRCELEILREDYNVAVELRDKLQSACDDNAGRLENLNSANSKLKEEKTVLEGKLKDAVESLKAVPVMEKQLAELEESKISNEAYMLKLRNDSMLKEEQVNELNKLNVELRGTLQKKDEEIRSLEQLAENLHKTIDSNHYEHEQIQSALRSEIERLKGGGLKAYSELSRNSGFVEENADDVEVKTYKEHKKTVEHKKRGRKKKLEISAIDESLEDSDWLCSAPHKDADKNKLRQTDLSMEFGYQETSRKVMPDNPAQMLLW